MDPGKYSITLADLQNSARVPREDQVEEQPVDSPHDVLAEQELERQRLLGISGASG